MSETPDEWTVLSMINWGTNYFAQKGIPSPRLSIEWILADVLNLKRLNLYLQFDRPLSGNELSQIRERVKRRARHEPLQYIVGHTDFMSARIHVNADVLIPRPETEQLTELILEKHSGSTGLKVLDIGTGSGCIAIALKLEHTDWKIYGLDISERAITVARENATLNDAEVIFGQADISEPETIPFNSERPFDIIVSNPPYIYPKEKETLDIEVRDFEPELALFHRDPREIYNQIIAYAEKYLRPDGHLYLELHEDYGPEILALFNKTVWDASIHPDYSQKNRFLLGKFLSD